MNKVFATLALLFVAIFAQAGGEIVVKVNGEAVDFPDGKPVEMVGRVMVPLRGVFEAMDAVVDYDPRMKTVSARKGNELIELHIGDKIAKKNGAEIMLEVAPVIRHGSTLVPLRFLAEALGGTVNFDAKTNTVEIATENLTLRRHLQARSYQR